MQTYAYDSTRGRQAEELVQGLETWLRFVRIAQATVSPADTITKTAARALLSSEASRYKDGCVAIRLCAELGGKAPTDQQKDVETPG